MSERTESAAGKVDGYLGNEYFRNEDGFGIHISYWRDEDCINEWRNHSLHKEAKQKGIEQWYEDYTVRICRVDFESKLK